MGTVRMINSVGDHVAGEEYELEADVADLYILSGYAEGELSREYSEAEATSARDGNQEVGLG